MVPASAAGSNGNLACGSLGDVNNDGSISTEDAALITQYIIGITDVTQDQQGRADVTSDGTVNIFDPLVPALGTTVAIFNVTAAGNGAITFEQEEGNHLVVMVSKYQQDGPVNHQ